MIDRVVTAARNLVPWARRREAADVADREVAAVVEESDRVAKDARQAIRDAYGPMDERMRARAGKG